MKEFSKITFDLDQCRASLAAFRRLLDSKEELDENADIKPFFEAHVQLSGLLGVYSWSYAHMDLVAFQYQLFGDFSCDQVVGDSTRRIYGFIEWEDATKHSLFRRQAKKATPEWSSRVERGFSQILDWFWKLDDMAGTGDFTARFGAPQIMYSGLLVVGRDARLTHPRERQRWDWRSRKLIINSQPIRCVTYDQLHADMDNWLNRFPPRHPPAGTSRASPE
jgi:hypothetical protein